MNPQVTDRETERPIKSLNRDEEIIPAIDVWEHTDEVPQITSDDISGITPLEDEEFIQKLRNVPRDKFRLNNQRLFLTYSQADIDKKQLKKHIKMCSKLSESKIKIARETHKDGNAHMHVLVDFGKAFQSRNCRIFDFEHDRCSKHCNGYHHPNIRVVKDVLHWANLLVYLGKQDKKCKAHPNVIAARNVWNAGSKAEAMLSGVDPMKASVLWDARPKPAIPMIPEPSPEYEWYHEVLVPIVLGPPDHRSWHWFYDPVGNTGKSWACDYLARAHPMDVRTTILTGSCDSLAYKICNWQDEGWTGRAIMIDLPRAKQDKEHIYTALEMLSNGRGDSCKYTGPSFVLARKPNVVLLANWLPVFHGTGSIDRWKLYHILPSLSARRMNLNEGRAEQARVLQERRELQEAGEIPDSPPRKRRDFSQRR